MKTPPWPVGENSGAFLHPISPSQNTGPDLETVDMMQLKSQSVLSFLI
jgi:hypothetical protein